MTRPSAGTRLRRLLSLLPWLADHPGTTIAEICDRFGFTEEPDVPAAIAALDEHQLKLDLSKVTYFLGRETLIAKRHIERMVGWREKLFVAMQRNATNATSYFRLPSDQVIELGSQVEI